MSDAIEFGFDDAKAIQTTTIERFKQDRHGRVDRISIISFKKFSDVIIAKKAKEKGEDLSDEEKAEIIKKIDAKLAEKNNKSVENLTEVDRLDINSPKFAYAWTHYGEDIGTIRCLSERIGKNVVKPALCCQRIGEADQTVGTVILRYPVDNDGNVDIDLFNQRKYTAIEIYRVTPKKFKKLESAYGDARNNNFLTIDLKVSLDGDPKYQKQVIENGLTAVWAREGINPEVRNWVLDQGIKAWKHVEKELGFAMKPEMLSQKLTGQMSSGHSDSGASASKPQLQTNYDTLLE